MCSRGSIVCVYFFICVVRGSSIFTRRMIRMPEQPYSSLEMNSNKTSEPMILTSKTDDKLYEIIYPVKLESEKPVDDERRSGNGERKIIFTSGGVEPDNNLESGVITPVSRKLFQETPGVSEYNDPSIDSSKTFNTHEDDKSILRSTESNSLSHVDLKSDKNVSSDDSRDIFWGTSSSKAEKGFPDLNFWIVLQRFFSCGWSSEWVSCLHESFDPTSDNSFFLRDLLLPRTPPQQTDEESTEEYPDDEEELDLDSPDQDEGRKRLSKKLQSLIPLLLMLKMTMVPALAVMALMTGKAFLVSLVSLGVALFSALFSPSGVLSASKRHEIASQSTIPQDQTSSNYYYMM